MHPMLPVHPPDIGKLPPPRPRPDHAPVEIVHPPFAAGSPVVVVGRRVPVIVVSARSESAILALSPPRRGVVIPAVAPNEVIATTAAPQQYAAAQAQLQQAQAGCAQADAYQNYVNQVVNSQNTTTQDFDQILQTLADNTTDPNIQNALLNSIGQPNPINDALDQQLQNQANLYESACQARLAAAQAAAPPDPTQQAGAVAANYQPGISAGNPGATGGQRSVSGPAQTTPQAGVCPAEAATNLPQPSGSWGPWVALGSSGLVFDVSRVNDGTLTWRFLNAGPNTIAALQFNYSYVDANTGLPATQSDVLPFALAPAQSVGGWAAYTANTKGNITLTITQISCQ
jgi:hypothetical protein